jgi:RNase P protein component
MIIIIRNGAKTRSPQNFIWELNKKLCKNNKSPIFVWGLNNNKKRCKINKSPNFVWGLNNNKDMSKHNMSHKLRLGATIIIIIRNGAKTISPQNFAWGLNNNNNNNNKIRNGGGLNSLPFMTFWCKIMTKTKFEL